MKEPVQTLANSSFDQATVIIGKEVDAYLLTCRTRGRHAREDARHALEAVMREFAAGNPKRKALIQAFVDEKIVREG